MYGDLSVRPRKTPTINLEAKTLTILISWDKDIHELVFTTKHPSDIVHCFVDTPFSTPYFPSRKQTTQGAALGH